MKALDDHVLVPQFAMPLVLQAITVQHKCVSTPLEIGIFMFTFQFVLNLMQID